MSVVKATVSAALEPRASAAGFERVDRGVWQHTGPELVGEIRLEMSNGTRTERNFSLDWAIYVPGLGSLLYAVENDPARSSAWPAVKGGSQQVHPSLAHDWLKVVLPLSESAEAALVHQLGVHADAMLSFLATFRGRREVRIFLLESDDRDWLRMHQPTSRIRKLEVAAGLAVLDRDIDDAERLAGELEAALAASPWKDVSRRRPLSRLRAVMDDPSLRR